MLYDEGERMLPLKGKSRISGLQNEEMTLDYAGRSVSPHVFRKDGKGEAAEWPGEEKETA